MSGSDKPSTTTPEDPFAVNYVTCFSPARDFVTRNMLKFNPNNIEIHCDVGINTCEEGGFGLGVGLTTRISGLSRADVEKLVAQAHQVYPYSNATCNSVEITLKTEVV